MLDKLAAQESKRTLGDAELTERAERLSEQYFSSRARPRSVRWVTNQNTRWGSCTPAEGSIRLSHRLQGMPEYVVDYVLLHELAHLLVPGHGPASGNCSRPIRAPSGPAATSREWSPPSASPRSRRPARNDPARAPSGANVSICTGSVPAWPDVGRCS